MKCPDCQKSWAPSDAAAKAICPYCGSTDSAPENIDEALWKVASLCGVSFLEDGQKLTGALLDLAPNMKKEYNLVRSLVESGGHTRLFSVRNAASSRQETELKIAMRDLTDSWGMSEDNAASLCRAYLNAAMGAVPSTAKAEEEIFTPHCEKILDVKSTVDAILKLASQNGKIDINASLRDDVDTYLKTRVGIPSGGFKESDIPDLYSGFVSYTKSKKTADVGKKPGGNNNGGNAGGSNPGGNPPPAKKAKRPAFKDALFSHPSGQQPIPKKIKTYNQLFSILTIIFTAAALFGLIASGAFGIIPLISIGFAIVFYALLFRKLNDACCYKAMFDAGFVLTGPKKK
ncbi:MAG: hypothetical protein IIW34_04400 [Clostridia bacterium]|nr:hypothetical protein [Clostridia bacterium]